MSRIGLIGCVLAAVLFGPAMAFGTEIYLNDDFNDDGGGGGASADGWTTYRSPTGAWGDIPHLTPKTSLNIFVPWNDPVSSPGFMGFDNGGALVPAEGQSRMYSGMWKQFTDKVLPEEEKWVEVWIKCLSSDYGDPYAVPPIPPKMNDELKARVGFDPTGGTDPLSGSIIWSPEYNGDWSHIVLGPFPCTPNLETIFVEATTSFANGYQAIGIAHVYVWQTPEPAMMLLMGLPALLLRRRIRR